MRLKSSIFAIIPLTNRQVLAGSIGMRTSHLLILLLAVRKLLELALFLSSGHLPFAIWGPSAIRGIRICHVRVYKDCLCSLTLSAHISVFRRPR